jgi:acetylornithine deacetylase/succinyl-diaminopimelate desuccinylase
MREAVLGCIRDDEVIQLTQDLVRIPSPVGEERALGEHLAAYLRAMGLEVSVRDVHDGRLNVVGILPGEQAGEIALLFHGHMDTIPFLAMPDPLSARVEDGQIWGRGSVDQKGGLAASILAIRALAEARVPLRKGVAVAAVVDEESEHRGSYALVDDGFRADFAIVTEPSDLQLIVGHKGTVPARITVLGKTAHGSTPWLGINAIERAARLVGALSKIEPRAVDVPGVGRMQGTLNVGLVNGGTAYNNVPNRCEVWIDRRTVPGESQATVLAEIRSVLAEQATADPQFRAEVEVARPDWRWPRIKERGLNPSATLGENALTLALGEAHRQVTGEPPVPAYNHGYLDMDFLVNDLGIPTVNYGPGEDALCHTDEEHLSIAHLLAATRVYALTALALAR